VKVRVSYHGIEIETELPDVGGEHFSDNALGKNSWKQPYPFVYEQKDTAADVAVRLIRESVESIQVLAREGSEI
jgi:hypothetical protein